MAPLGLGCRVLGLGVQGLGFRGLKVSGLAGFRVLGLGFWVIRVPCASTGHSADGLGMRDAIRPGVGRKASGSGSGQNP